MFSLVSSSAAAGYGPLNLAVMQKKQAMSKKKAVLSDHVRQGKVFKPPMSQLGVFEATSWRETTMPELLWIGLVLDRFELKHSIDLTLSLAQEAETRSSDRKALCFAFTSSYDVLSARDKAELSSTLMKKGELDPLREALAPMKWFYPECPLTFLYEGDSMFLNPPPTALSDFKRFLAGLYNKRGRVSVLMQAQAVYMLGMAGRLFIQQGTSLGDLNALSAYPDTTESLKVGASVCAACNMLVRTSLEAHDSHWADYFWDCSFEMDGCEYDLPYEA